MRGWPLALAAAVLAALVFGIYGQTLRHGFSVLDDDDYVVKNLIVQNGLTLRGFAWAMTTGAVANWHPVTWLSHMLDCQIFGMEAGGHHAINTLLHLINSVLLFFVFRAMTGATRRSLLLAALFAAHPLHVESVAWISERKDVLSAFFWIAAMGAYVRYARNPGVMRYLGVAVLFALALMAKPMAVTLPCVFLLLDYWPLGRCDVRPAAGEDRDGRTRRSGPKKRPKPVVSGFSPSAIGAHSSAWPRLVLEKLPLFAMSAASSVITFIVQQRGGAMRTLEAMPLFQRIGNVFISYVRYAGKAIWPSNLSVYYPHLGAETRGWIVLAAAVALAAATFWVWRGARTRRYLAVGWLWFLGTLVPVIGIVQVGSQSIADRYMYLPIVGLFIMALWGLHDVAAWLRSKAPWFHTALPMAAGCALVLAYAAAAFAQTAKWRDNITLFEHSLKATSGNDFVHYNVGIALKRAGRLDEALHHFQKAVEFRHSYVAARIYIGLIHYEKGEYEAAIREYEQAMQFAAGHPNHADLENDLGVAYFSMGKMEEAASHYTKALQINPNDPDAHYNLGLTLQRLKRHDEALRHVREAVRLNPRHEPARNLAESLEKEAAAHRPAVAVPRLAGAGDYFTRGNELADAKKYAEAAAHYEEALKLKPDFTDARINLGNALAVQGRLREAAAQFREAARLQPNSGDAFLNLGHALTELGELGPAGDAYAKAASLNPRNVEAWIGLGFALARQNKPQEAREPLRKAIALDPDNERAKEALTNIEKYLREKQ